MNEKLAVISKRISDLGTNNPSPKPISDSLNDAEYVNQKTPVTDKAARLATTQPNSALARAKSYDIGLNPNSPNYQQYVTTVNAYVKAEMPFVHIANAGDELGDKVIRGEVDAPIKLGLENKVSEVVENEGRTIAWQNRGEVLSLTPQIATTSSFGGTEIVQTTQNLVQNQSTGTHSINVIEGISVSQAQQPSLTEATTNNITDISQNPYLKAPAIIK